jgi:hypothetical protein
MQDIQNHFPGFPSVASNQIGLATVEISNAYAHNVLDLPKDEDAVSIVSALPFRELNELKHVELKLLDGRLIDFTVYYPNDIKWKSADEFVQNTGKALKLNGSWQKIGSDDDYSEVRSLRCGDNGEDFTINAGFRKPPSLYSNLADIKLPYVEVKDFWHGEMELFKRKRESEDKAKREEEQRKQTFSP